MSTNVQLDEPCPDGPAPSSGSLGGGWFSSGYPSPRGVVVVRVVVRTASSSRPGCALSVPCGTRRHAYHLDCGSAACHLNCGTWYRHVVPRAVLAINFGVGRHGSRKGQRPKIDKIILDQYQRIQSPTLPQPPKLDVCLERHSHSHSSAKGRAEILWDPWRAPHWHPSFARRNLSDTCTSPECVERPSARRTRPSRPGCRAVGAAQISAPTPAAAPVVHAARSMVPPRTRRAERPLADCSVVDAARRPATAQP